MVLRPNQIQRGVILFFEVLAARHSKDRESSRWQTTIEAVPVRVL